MSVKHLLWAMESRPSEPLDKLVLLYLAEICDQDTDTVHVSLAKVVRFCVCSDNEALGALESLHSAGLIGLLGYAKGYANLILCTGRSR